jgi:hypothetical protein|tara:strand:+ start:491 stop:769 length:279 start_codon:yes stop_codon:yes gene_type:complete
MKSDIKAVRVTATGSVFSGRTRLRGIILENDHATDTQSITLQDGSSVTQFLTSCPAGDVFSFNMPEDGILFAGGMTVSAIGANVEATLLIDK